MKQLVSKFSKAMTKELEENSHKSGWDDLSPRHCLRRAEQEMGELRRAVERGDPLDKIRSEAADVGNFLAMLIWNLDREIRDAKKNKTAAPRREW